MKITFLVPPVLIGNRATERVAGCTYTLYPVPNLYELTVAALMEREGFDVRYTESVMNDWKRADFENYLQSDDSQAYIIYTVNLGIENDLLACEIIRKIRGEDIPVIFQGPGPTHFVDKFLTDEQAFVIRGEPEYSLLDLMKNLKSGGTAKDIAGVSYRTGDRIIHNEPRDLIDDLDELPFPARHLLPDHMRYNFSNPKLGCGPYTAVVTSRNCPFKCIYCVPSSLSFARELEFKRNHNRKPPVTKRSIEHVAKEIQMLVKEGYKSISFQDDNFVWSEKRTVALCEVMAESGLLWGCQSRADLLTEPKVRAMAASGCVYVDIGVESFNQPILDYIQKGETVEEMIQGISLLKKYGIMAKVNVLVGTSPLETKETIRENERVIRNLGVDQVMFSMTAPFPGTEFYDMAKENGWFTKGDYYPVDVQKTALVSFPNLSNTELEKEVNRANRRFYLNPKTAFKHIRKFRSVRDFTTASKALYRKLWA